MDNHGKLTATLSARGTMRATIQPRGVLRGITQPGTGSGGGGTNDYEQLVNKPSINTRILVGDKDGNELGLINSSDILGIEEIDRMFAAVFGN